MPIRNTHKVGDWLIEDEESGHIVYRSQVRKIWNGTYRRAKSYETRQPQEFVRAKNDPKALSEVRPAEPAAKACNSIDLFVGSTTVPAPKGPAAHLYDPGVDDMEIGCTFVVR